MPKVSVIIPVYGVEKYIERCARSLFEQTLDDMEFIFIDDCSPDRSIETLERVLQEYPNRIPQTHILHNETNMGPAQSRNYALDIYHGEYVAFVDSDDTLPLYSLEHMLRVAVEENADIVRGDYARVYENGIKRHHVKYPHTRLEYIKALLTWGEIPQGACIGIYTRRLVDCSGARFMANCHYGEDFYFSAIISSYAKKISSIPEVVYYYTTNLSSLCHKFPVSHAEGLISVSDRIRDFYMEKEDWIELERSIERGRAKIKAFILCNISPNLRRKYHDIFMELSKESHLSLVGRVKMFSAKRYPLLYRLLNKIVENKW